MLAGLLLDVLVNLTVASVIFLEGPREWLVTKRLQRYMRAPAGWRFHLAWYICERILDPFDPTGDHC